MLLEDGSIVSFIKAEIIETVFTAVHWKRYLEKAIPYFIVGEIKTDE